MHLEGFISIKAAIKAKNRDMEKVYISNHKRTRKSSFMKKLCVEEKIKFKFVDKEFFKSHAISNSHGGFLAKVGPRKSLSLTQLLKNNYYFYFVGVEDPYNLATNIRTIYAAGISGVILDQKDYSDIEMRLSKSSAGTYEYINLSYSDDLQTTIKQASLLGYDIVSIDQNDDSVPLYETEINRKTIFIVGGEKRGINGNIEEFLTKTIHIPYGQTFGYSLPSTVATSVIAFEVLRRESK